MGDYDVEIPEGTPPGMYTIRVGVFENAEVYDCSGEFEVLGDGSGMDAVGDMSMSYRF